LIVRRLSSPKDLTDKVFAITDATSGISKNAVRDLAKMNAKIVIIARNEESAKQVKDEFVSETK